jgi:hypothetical protein
MPWPSTYNQTRATISGNASGPTYLSHTRQGPDDAGMSVCDSKVFLPARVERKDQDVKAAMMGAPAQLAGGG